jgi:hypothetical protein
MEKTGLSYLKRQDNKAKLFSLNTRLRLKMR